MKTKERKKWQAMLWALTLAGFAVGVSFESMAMLEDRGPSYATASDNSRNEAENQVPFGGTIIGADAYTPENISNPTAVGYKAQALATSATALGYRSKASAESSTAIGALAETGGVRAVAIGYFSNAKKENSIAIGQFAQTQGAYSISMGYIAGQSELYAKLSGEALNGTISIGERANGVGASSIALGRNTMAYGGGSLAIGSQAAAGNSADDMLSIEQNALAVGTKAAASGKDSLAIGREATASQEGVIAIGTSAAATGQWTLAMGYQAKAGDSHATAIGTLAEASGEETVALGSNAKATSYNSIAIGIQAKAEEVSSVALGANSRVRESYSVSVGNSNRTRKITYVTAGEVNSDAATYGQIAKSNLAVTLSTSARNDAGKYNQIVANNGTVLATFESGLAEEGNMGFMSGDAAWKADVANGTYAVESDGTVTVKTNGNQTAFTISGLSSGGPDVEKGKRIYASTGARDDDTAKQKNVMYDNAGNAIATFEVGDVAKGNTGFVSGGTVWNSSVKTDQIKTITAASNTFEIVDNRGKSLFTGTVKSGTYGKGDTGFISGDTAWQNSVAAGQEINGDNLAVYANGDTAKTNPIITIKKGNIGATQNGFVTGETVYKSLVRNTTYGVTDGKVTVLDNEGNTAFTITGIGGGESYTADEKTITMSDDNVIRAKTGAVFQNAETLVTGGDVYTAITPTKDGVSIKTTKSLPQNLAALDEADIASGQHIRVGNAEIKNNAGTAVVTIDEGTVASGNTGFVSGDAVWNASVKTAQTKTITAASNTFEIVDNRGKSLFTGTVKSGTYGKGDTGFISGDTAWQNSVAAGQEINGDNLAVYANGDTAKTNPIITIKKGNIGATQNGFVTGETVYKSLVRNTTYGVTDGKVTVLDNEGNTAFTITGIGGSSGGGSAEEYVGDNQTIRINTETGANVIEAVTGDVSATNEGLVTGETLYTYLAPAEGNYVSADKTAAKNLSALDEAVGVVHQEAGETLYVIGETFGSTRSAIGNSVAHNLKLLDAKVGAIDDRKTNVVKNDYTISKNLEELDKRIAEDKEETEKLISINDARDTIYIGAGITTVSQINMGNRTIVNVKAGAKAGEAAVWDQIVKAGQTISATTEARTDNAARQQNILYDNAGTKIATMNIANAVTSGSTGFVSSGLLYNALPQNTTFQVAYDENDVGTVIITNNKNEEMFRIGNILNNAGSHASVTGDNKTIRINTETGANVIEAITGDVSAKNEGLVTGETLYTYLAPAAGHYVSDKKTTAQNLNTLDDVIGVVRQDAGETLHVIGETFAEDGKTIANSVSANLEKLDAKIGTIDDTKTQIVKNDYTVSKNLEELDRQIVKHREDVNNLIQINEAGNTIVIGGGVTNVGRIDMGNRTITNVKGATTTGDVTTYEQIAKMGQTVTLNVDTDAAGKAGNTLVTNDNQVIATFKEGSISKTDKNFISGSTLYSELRPMEGTNVKENRTTAENLNALDNALVQNDTYTVAKNGTVTVMTNDGHTAFTIKGIAAAAGGGNYFGDDRTITVNDDNIISALTGDISKDNEGLVTGNTLYTELRPEDGNYIRKANTAAQNLTALDAVAKENSDNISQEINQRKALISVAGDTLHIGKGDSATVIDVKNQEGDRRVMTGVVTDETDETSAVSVDYLKGAINNYNETVTADVKDVGAVSAALAALHPLSYDPMDKLSFAVAGGSYRGASAFAMGGFYQPNEDLMFNVSGTIGSRHNAWNVGMSFRFGKAGDRALLTANNPRLLVEQLSEMNRRNDAQVAEIREIRAENAEQKQKLEVQEKELQNQKNEIKELRRDNEELRRQMEEIVRELHLNSVVTKSANR